MPENLPDPETLTSAKELMQPFAEKSPFANYYAEKSPFDIRHVTPTVMLRADKDSAEHDSGKQMVWMKADGHVDVPQVMHLSLIHILPGRYGCHHRPRGPRTWQRLPPRRRSS